MRYDMGDWDKGKDAFIARLAAGAWRHGIKTEDAMKEIIRGGKFPVDLSTMQYPKWKKKNGDMPHYGLYYFTQRALKNEYVVLIGRRTGDPYRVRRFYCVPHGSYEGEEDAKGNPRSVSKQGLWLRREDLIPADVHYLGSRYSARETDSGPTKKYLRKAEDKSKGKPWDITMGELEDEILDDL